jgi:hypothetical protein
MITRELIRHAEKRIIEYEQMLQEHRKTPHTWFKEMLRDNLRSEKKWLKKLRKEITNINQGLNPWA